MKGQKVFTALYDWMLQEYRRQGVTSGKDLVMPVRTVWGWYMKGQGLQNGQRVDESETGHGLMCIVSNAACIRREVPKVDRLVVMADDEVHPTFRVRAEQWIGEEVVYICDVANHPTDAERVAICAVPRAFLDSLMPSEKNEGSEKPLPKPKQKPRVKKNTPNYEERSLFDDLLFEFAKSCHDSEFRCERSAWTGRYVQYYTTSDIKTLWSVGLMVITFVYYLWADWMLDNTDPLELDVVTVFAPFGVAFLAWSLFVLWLNNRVDEIRKGKKN